MKQQKIKGKRGRLVSSGDGDDVLRAISRGYRWYRKRSLPLKLFLIFAVWIFILIVYTIFTTTKQHRK